MPIDTEAAVTSTDQISTQPESAPESQLSNVALLGAAAATVALAGCSVSGAGGSDGDDAPPTPPANTITALRVTAADGSTVSVNGTPSSTEGARYALDGAPLASDPGATGLAVAYDFNATGAAGSSSLQVIINPTPSSVSSALNSVIRTTRASIADVAFAPSWEELMSFSGMNHEQIVDRLLSRYTGIPTTAYPAWIDTPIANNQPNRYEDRQAFKAWFFEQMVTSTDPLTERLLVFWHNHFTTSANDVDYPQLIARQHRLYRQYVRGNFRDFVKAVSRDPAMVIYLDSVLNRKGVPNENFARELLELFTMGEAATYNGYLDSEIPVVARAFTGYGLTNPERIFQFNPSDHDNASKTLWGQTRTDTPSTPISGDGDWVIDVILAKRGPGLAAGPSGTADRNYTAYFVCTKLWKEFLGTPSTADEATILTLSDQFAGAMGWDLTALYRTFFKLSAFTDPARRGTRYKSPIEIYVTYFRAVGLKVTDNGSSSWDDYLWVLYTLDQDVLTPPSVFGWPGGEKWLTVKTFVDRRQFMGWLGYSYRTLVPDRLKDVLDILLMAIDPVVPPRVFSYLITGDRASDYITDPAYNLR